MFFAKETSGSSFQGQGNHVLSFLASSAQAQTLLDRYGMGAAQLQQGRLLATTRQARPFVSTLTIPKSPLQIRLDD